MPDRIDIPGYEIREKLYDGTRTLVYRGTRTADAAPIVIKILKNEYPGINELFHFRNQYKIAQRLDHPGIVKPLALEDYHNRYALVMEDFGGISLANYHQAKSSQTVVALEGNSMFPLNLFLSIAIQLADALHHLYQHQVIHKDIKPANILINPEQQTIQVIDFSISSLLPRETQDIKNPTVLEGTLAYLSPEQTGRMNRGVDYRSDFYALGVTFYQLLTGVLPFASDDPMELVHYHLAKTATPIHAVNANIPSVLSDIVAKLMAKNGEDRYQTALGLKYDLERCLTQLQTTGKIESFALAERDISDRYIIPEKLYGRSDEIQTLLDAFERVSNGHSETMLVAGFSGVGKTAVIQEVHKPIAKRRGYFIKGKYDQFQRNIPFTGFVQAFRDLVRQLLCESDEKLEQFSNKILAAVGQNGQVLIEVIPELKDIIGPQPPVSPLTGVAAQRRFNLLFKAFVQLFSAKDHPLVIFLDDLQWADSASLDLLLSLIEESRYLLLLGAYRDNEVSPIHPFILTVTELINRGSIVNRITLPPLHKSHINQLVADTLTCDRQVAQPLTEFIYQRTHGNPFFTTQFLKALYDEKLIYFNWARQHWECDLAQVEALALTEDVVEFMALQLQKMPTETQESLKLAACIGAEFDLATLSIVSEQSLGAVAATLWIALEERFIIPKTKVYTFLSPEDLDQVAQGSVHLTYQFLHDRIQQASYSLIPETQKQATHLKIGQLLQQNLSDIEQAEKLFEIVGHLNSGRTLISATADRESLAQLNLAAAHKALTSTAYAAARDFAAIGLSLLCDRRWQSQYRLTLELVTVAAEAAFLTGDFEAMRGHIEEGLNAAQTTLDKIDLYEIKIHALASQSHVLEAIAVGQYALSELGIAFSSDPDDALTQQVLDSITRDLQHRDIEDLVNLPPMSDPQMSAAMQLLALLFLSIYQGKPTLLSLVCGTMVKLSLEFGNSPASTIGYASYGMVLATFFEQSSEGYRFGRVALDLRDRLNVQDYQSMTLLLFGLFLQHRQEALRTNFDTLKKGYVLGMENGNFVCAGYNIGAYFDDNFFAGVEFDKWEADIEQYCDAFIQIQYQSPISYLRLKQQMVQNWKEPSQKPQELIGTAYDETVMIPRHQQENDFTVLAFLYVYKLMFAYSFGHLADALTYIDEMEPYLMAATGTIQIPVFHFYAALTYLEQASQQDKTESAASFKKVEQHREALAQWADCTPINYQHKLTLLDAEKAHVIGQRLDAIEGYDQAISQANETEYLQDEALGNELAARFYLRWGKEKVAAGYMQDAYYCYTKWGAKAKVTQLEEQYPQLIKPILKQPSIVDPLQQTIVSGLVSSGSSSSSMSQAIDLAALLKASQAISEEIELDKLITTLIEIVIANAGADKCVLLLKNQQNLEVVALAEVGQDPQRLKPIPLESSSDIPITLVNQVKRTKRSLVLLDSRVDPQAQIDPYLQTHQPKSILCSPILNQGQLVGILYLENNLTIGAFTGQRVQVLSFICSQASISLENARLYEKANQALIDLQEAQLQVIQNEKMSTLGSLVAGVAHEINNPVGFLNGNIQPALDYVNDLFQLLQLIRDKYPDLDPDVEDEIEAIELEYIQEDLPKLIGSMREGVKRIQNISNSLRTFSRADSDRPIPCNLHDGIDSTIMILKHRLKANEIRPEIQVIKDYGQLPDIECYAGQLNQVFMNLLSNSIDALEESNQGKSYREIQNKITIKTELSHDQKQVQIRLQDNGIGMSEAVKNKVFENWFTTKRVGQGTGLGLAIARQIVVEKHNGTIEINSELGQGTEFMVRIPTHSCHS
ncbi:trifunctional serine/threonine-protein kinase/ATP-binding protein/sensor histidine kinase [Sodalinema gerasimenkoae]|uniref:trifunctional serine/threonine-protein kinase/ATP-binding protein/sensor histidine kinase n=1 Tax=Sodalinema gerasimenkoae TaxID=2862348 RepID=UPI00135C1B23|nr:ATP-binding sensor histidine kinase [Sodalinema gerasimenkoae]